VFNYLSLRSYSALFRVKGGGILPFFFWMQLGRWGSCRKIPREGGASHSISDTIAFGS
jgi:hypothetical protein